MARLQLSLLYMLGAITMGFLKHVVIESKVFLLSKDGDFMFITKRSWKVMNELRLGLSTV